MTPSKNVFHILLAFGAHGENFDLAICICHNNPVSYENFDEVLSFPSFAWLENTSLCLTLDCYEN